MECYSAIKRNTFESVLRRWTNLEPIIQSKVSQKKNINIIFWCIYMEYRKMVLMNLFAGQQWRNRYKEQTYGHRGRGGGRRWDIESNMEIYSAICKIDSQWEFAVWLRELKPGLCNNLEGWEGGSRGRGSMYTCGWFILRFDRKQQNSVKQLSFNKK